MDLHILTGKTNRRDTFRNLIVQLGLKNGVEVGCLYGYFAADLLDSGLEKLISVDIQKLPCIVHMEEQYKGRYEFIEMDSIHAAKQLQDDILDLVYLDGDHSEYVLGELEAWWPKIRSGGILSGHDFIIYEHPELGHYRVVESVFEFCEKNNLKFWINGLTSTDKSDIMNKAVEIGRQQKQVELGKRREHVEIPNFIIRKE